VVESLLAIERLKEADGIGPSTVGKLRQAGFYTVESVAVAPLRELISRVGLGDEMALRVIDAARGMVSADFITAEDLYRVRKNAQRLTTGSRALDAILGGGIETQAITEFAGEFGSGKSQICMMLSATCQLPKERGGLEGSALFIDTEGTFTPQRVYAMAKGLGLDPEGALKRIIYSRAYNSDHQMLLVDRCGEVVQKEGVRLLVVDSVVSHFRGEYLGREALAERQQKLNLHVHKLLRLAEAFNLAVVVTNQVMANPATYFGDPNRPAGGNILAHASTHRVYLRKCKANIRHASIIDSPSLPPNEEPAAFMITAKGIEDVPEKEGRALRVEDAEEA
jgi:DNA repair protein RadA